MPTRRYFSNFAPRQTLANSIGSSDTTCQIAGSFAGWPTQFPFYATLGYGLSSAEIVQVTNIVGTAATIVRGADGSTPIAHPAGETMDQTAVRLDYDEANAHTSASSGVHGITGNVVGDTDAQTLSNKTLTNPVINGVQGNLHPTGNLTVDGTATLGGAATVAGLLTPEAGVALTTVTDWNSISTFTGASGFLYGSASALNSPIASTPFYGTWWEDSSGDVYVIASALTSSSTAPLQYQRTKPSGGAWTSWALLGGDTGWQNITAASGFTSLQAQARLKNGIVYLRGGIKINTGTYSTSGNVCGTLPNGMAPPANGPSPFSRMSTPGFGSSTANGNILLLTPGSTSIEGASSNGTNTLYLDGFSYTID